MFWGQTNLVNFLIKMPKTVCNIDKF